MAETGSGAADSQKDALWRWRWGCLLVLLVAASIAASLLAAALSGAGGVVSLAAEEYESQAIIEIVDNRPISERQAEALAPGDIAAAVKTRAMSWNAIREIVLSRKVDIGCSIDPDDRNSLQLAYNAVQEAIRIEPYGGPFIKVSCRGPRPEFNAALVNQIVKGFVSEDRRHQEDRAKQDLEYCRDRLASARNPLLEIDGQIREFATENPWLGDSLAEIDRQYSDAEESELQIRRDIDRVEENLAEVTEEIQKQTQEASRKPFEEQVRRLKRELGRLNVRKLDANKRISTLYVRRRKAPELLAEKRALAEQRAVAAQAASECAKELRLAEEQLERLLTEGYSSRFRVVEYARADTTPVFDERDGDPEDGGGETGIKSWGGTGAFGVGLAIGLCPTLVFIVAFTVLGRRQSGAALDPGRARRVGVAMFWSVGLILPVVLVFAAVTLYRVADPVRGAATDARDRTRAAWRALQSGQPSTADPAPAAPSEPLVAPKSVKSFIEGDIKFAQLDSDGMVLSVTHYFRELLPDGAAAFTVKRDADNHGTILLYRLRNPGTLDIFEFKDVEARRFGGEWEITEEGWKKIRDELQVHMKVRLGRPML